MQVRRFDASRWGFPRPSVPVLPRADSLLWQRTQAPGFRTVFDARTPRHYARGRYALRDALLALDIGPHAGVLAPAYHCRTMLDPALMLGAPIRLYEVNADLSPSMPSLERCVTLDEPGWPRALLLPHYFGMPQELRPVAAFCGRHGLELIEDCSHNLFVGEENETVGRTGTMAIGSPYKFFAAPDGGLLWANGKVPLPREPLRIPPVGQQVRALLDGLRATAGSHAVPNMATLPNELAGALQQLRMLEEDPIEDGGVSMHYDAREQEQTNLMWSRLVQRHANIPRLVHRRRAHYQRWLDAVTRMEGCRALFPALPKDSVPYMFPLLVDNHGLAFQMLKRLGVPIWRWDDMAVSQCDIARRYRLQLLHLPCHQDLDDAQLEWMIATLAAVVKATKT